MKYTLIEQKHMNELNGEGYIYKHNKSGAKLFFIKNEDKNKTFSITFRTPPYDDTGLPHILEHSVLCGSRKFPLKDPFNELLKGSLNTFLNAMTFSDKTMYPVASMNDKDFVNLMDVYLDAVLYPNIHTDPMILKQEGWHYELTETDADVIYKGVVYNEMKGAFSTADSVLSRRIQQYLYPDTAYHFESGGDPDAIPDLTSEDFLAFHKKYYHPSNAYIYLYGNIDVEEKLKWLDEMYLNDFDAIELDSSIQIQPAFESVQEATLTYPIASNESEDEKAFLSQSYVLGANPDKVERIGLEVLEYILMEAPGAILKEALLKAGIGQDVYGSLDTYIQQPSLSIVAKHAKPEDKEAFVKVINDTFTKISEEGLDSKKLTAAINYFEFRIKEADFGGYPKGIIYAIKALDSWLYDQSPFEHFEYNEAFSVLKENLDKGYFEGLIRKYFVENTHVLKLSLLPDKELSAKKEAEVKGILDTYKSGLDKEAIEALVEETKALETYQSEEASAEAIASIPLLDLTDVDKEVNVLEMDVEAIKGVEVLRHHTFTNDILYMKWLFDMSMIPFADLPYAKLLVRLLGKISTEKYGYSDLSDEINIHTGGISFGAQVYSDDKETVAYYPKLEVSGKCFMDKRSELVRIVEEIIMNTTFDDQDRIKDLVMETKLRTSTGLSSGGHGTSLTRAESYFSKASKVKDQLSGIGFLQALTEIETLMNDDMPAFIQKLSEVKTTLFKGSKLIIGTTYQDSYREAMETLLDEHLDIYDNETELGAVDDVVLEKLNEGFMTSDKIQYVAKAGNFKEKGFEYNGSMKVLKSIIARDYLWTNIRIKGGAYGAMTNFKRNGNLFFVSYRDPNLVQTIHHYDVLCDYVEGLELDERELRKYILGTVSDMDQPLTPSMENDKVISMYVAGVTDEALQVERTQVLETSQEDVVSLSSVIQKVMGDNNLCVLGNEHKISEEKDVFNEIKYLNQ